MNIIIEFIGQSYMTLMLLLGLVIIMLVNRRIKIDGVRSEEHTSELQSP